MVPFLIINLELTNNAWEQITLTMSSTGEPTFYRNGVNANTNSPSNKRSTPTTKMDRTGSYLGESHFVERENFKGTLDGFRIYSRELTVNEAKCMGHKESCKNNRISIIILLIIKY